MVVNRYGNHSNTVKLCAMYDALLACAQIAETEGIILHLEALNVTTDHPGNFLKTTRMGAEICRMIGSPRLKLLFDAYHMQLSEGCLCDTLSATSTKSAIFISPTRLGGMSRAPVKSIIPPSIAIWKSWATADG